MKAAPTIFLSYNRKNALDADQIDNDFKAVGINFRRDIRDIEYRANIKDFMNNIGESDFVLMLISDEFLKSDWCMYEVSELVNTHKFREKILPIVLQNADSIFSPKSRISYYEYWKGRLKDDSKIAAKFPNQDTVEVLNRTKNIESNLGTFFNEITQLNLKAIDALKTENYSSILELVGFDDQAITQEVLGIWQLTESEEREIALMEFQMSYPDNENYYFAKGYFSQQEGKVKLAKLLYEKTIELKPESAKAYNNLGWILQSSYSDFEEAKSMYEKALKLDPKLVQAYNNMGSLLQDGFSDFEGAERMYTQGIQLDPNFALTYYNWGRLLQSNYSDFEGAKGMYEKALKYDPNFVLAYNNLGNLLQDRYSDFERAQEMYEKAITIDPINANVYYNWGRLLQNNKRDITGAKEKYETVLKLDPGNINAYNNLGVLLQNDLENFVEAKIMYEKAISIEPNFIIANCNLGILLAKNLDQFDQGKAYYVKTKELANYQSNPEWDTFFGVD